jgi:hypothetical protein
MKYLLFKHNRHEIKAARNMAASLGVEVFRCYQGSGPEDAIIDVSSSEKNSVSHKFCPQLWNILILNSDGGIMPCCYLFFKEDDFGDHVQNQIMQVRNNPLFVTARKLFNASEALDLPRSMQHPCLKCELVHDQAHLHEYLASNAYAQKGHRTGGP